MTGPLDDAGAELRVMRDEARSTIAATDGRTAEGKRARLVEKSLTRLMEDLDDEAAP